ncbi:MAG: DUF1016 domain-containing protein [Ketobacter sp.]|nr:DUF1016 domain-containing protein [Ketobacter sp.]
MNTLPIDHEENCRTFLDEVKQKVRYTRTTVARTASRELIQLYWWLGKAIVDKQETLAWGKSVVEQLAQDLRQTFAGRSGFSTQNLWYMR